jgi:hypothetical protein
MKIWGHAVFGTVGHRRAVEDQDDQFFRVATIFEGAHGTSKVKKLKILEKVDISRKKVPETRRVYLVL